MRRRPCAPRGCAEGAAAHPARSRPAAQRCGGRLTYRAGWGRGTTAVMENFQLLHLLGVPSPVPAPSRLPLPPPHPSVGGGGPESSATAVVGCRRLAPPGAFPPACPGGSRGTESPLSRPSQPWGGSCPRQSGGHCSGPRSGDGGEGFAVPRGCELLSCPGGRHSPGTADRQPPLAPSTGSRCCRRRERGR